MPLFPNSSSFLANGVFTDNSIVTAHTITHAYHMAELKPGPDRPGLKELLNMSIPGAAYDSSDRHPPPLCHPGTRNELIQQLVLWENHSEAIAWVKGPAGAGKSALCQSCAVTLGENLAASFFFSRPNRRSNPKLLFTTIAYQLAVKYKPYGKLLDEKIRQDLTIITKSLPCQFRELIAKPICEALGSGEVFPGKVIVVDGLDECDCASYQREILEIIARSVIDKTTPFRWIISSRLEPHIISKFGHPDFKSVTLHAEVTISRDLDPEIFRFLADKLVEIRETHGLDESWPCEEDLHTLVELSSGMFAYSHIISLFIDDDNSTSPMKQLDLVLDLAKQTKADRGSKHPLARLDLFYKTLILERLPWEKSQAVRLILLADYLLSQLDSGLSSRAFVSWMPKRGFTQAQRCANLLGHSEREFRHLCRCFHAVMIVDPGDNLRFYHASFMDFLLDPGRSGHFCIQSTDCVMKLLDHTKQALDEIQLDSDWNPMPRFAWGVPSKEHYAEQYYCIVTSFIKVLGLAIFCGKLDERRYAILKEWDFRKLALLGMLSFEWKPYSCLELYNCLKTQGGGLIKPYVTARQGFSHFLARMIEVVLFRKNTFILGHGEKSVSLQYFGSFSAFFACESTGVLTIRTYGNTGFKKFKRTLYEESLAKASSK